MSPSTPIWHQSLHLLAPSTAQPSEPFPRECPSARNPQPQGEQRAESRRGPGAVRLQPKPKPPTRGKLSPPSTPRGVPASRRTVRRHNNDRAEWERPCHGSSLQGSVLQGD